MIPQMPTLIKTLAKFLPRGVNRPVHVGNLTLSETQSLRQISIPVCPDGRIGIVKGMIAFQQHVQNEFLDARFTQYVMVDGPDPRTGVAWVRCDNEYVSCILYNQYIPKLYRRQLEFQVVVR